MSTKLHVGNKSYTSQSWIMKKGLQNVRNSIIQIRNFLFPQKILPNTEDTIVCSFNKSGPGEDSFDVILRLKIKSKEAALKWKEKLEEKPKTTYRVSKTYATKGKFVIFRVYK